MNTWLNKFVSEFKVTNSPQQDALLENPEMIIFAIPNSEGAAPIETFSRI
jgi:hypothetical protein